MALHVALLEAIPAPAAGRVARRCAEVDASLHLIGPLDFELDDPQFLKKGPDDWATLDWWMHPGWRDFRDAMHRERCLYFAKDGRDLEEAPFRANSVLIFGDESLNLPEKIRDKYPDRIFRIPAIPKTVKHQLQEGVAMVLAAAAEGAKAPVADTPKGKDASRRRHHRRS